MKNVVFGVLLGVFSLVLIVFVFVYSFFTLPCTEIKNSDNSVFFSEGLREFINYSVPCAQIEDLQYFGQFGDYFGGILNPILAFFSFCALMSTIYIQRKEYKESTKNQKEAAETAHLNALRAANEARLYYEKSLAEARKQRIQDVQRDEYRFVIGTLMTRMQHFEEKLYGPLQFSSRNGLEVYHDNGCYPTLSDYLRTSIWNIQEGVDARNDEPLNRVYKALRHVHDLSNKANEERPNYIFAVTFSGSKFIDDATNFLNDFQTYAHLLKELEIETNENRAAGANLKKGVFYLFSAFVLSNTIYHGNSKLDTRFIPEPLEFPELYKLFMAHMVIFDLPSNFTFHDEKC